MTWNFRLVVFQTGQDPPEALLQNGPRPLQIREVEAERLRPAPQPGH